MPNRSDYQAIFESGGVDALNQAIRERNPNPEIHALELMRMERQGVWKIEWDEETGIGRVTGRRTEV